MYEQIISDLEKIISDLEERLDNDDSFVDSDEFHEKYEAIKNRETEIDSQLPTFDEKMTKKQWAKFEFLRTRFDKCQKQIKKIEDEYDLDAGNDSAWMFPND